MQRPSRIALLPSCRVQATAGASQRDDVRAARDFALAAAAIEGVSERHCAAVAEVAERIAGELGVPPEVRRRTVLAGWLHDVGKAAMPDRILRARGGLDENDWILMRTHSAIGAVVAANDPLLADAAAGIRHHHEWFDGRGYPDRLVGARIPLEARIVACADAYVSMTTDRPHERPLTEPAALAELRRCAGGQLDPTCVEALLCVLAGAGVAAERAAA